MNRPGTGAALVGFVVTVVFAVACDAGEAVASAASEGESQAATGATEKVPASKGTPIDNDRFATVMPDDWKIHANDIEKMGMMTIVYGTRYEGVYFKFEHSGNYTANPMEQLASYAERMKGTAPVEVKINDTVWASTSYEYGGQKQSMMVTNHNGVKVTLTIVGDGYGEHPGVTAVIDKLVLK